MLSASENDPSKGSIPKLLMGIEEPPLLVRLVATLFLAGATVYLLNVPTAVIAAIGFVLITAAPLPFRSVVLPHLNLVLACVWLAMLAYGKASWTDTYLSSMIIAVLVVLGAILSIRLIVKFRVEAYRITALRKVSPLTLGLLAVGTTAVLSEYLFSERNPLWIILWLGQVLLAKYFWMILYSQESILNFRLRLNDFGLLFPSWIQLANHWVGSIPRGVAEFRSWNSNSRDWWIAFRYCLLALCLILSASVGTQLVFLNPYPLVHPILEGHQGLQWTMPFSLHADGGPLSMALLFKAWGGGFISGFFFLLIHAGVLILLWGSLSMIGIRVVFPLDRPWLAQSFGEFLTRFYVYYVDVLRRFFWIPCVIALKKMGFSVRTATFVGLAFSLIVGGTISHLLLAMVTLVDRPDFSNVLIDAGRFLPYFILLLVGVFLFRKNSSIARAAQALHLSPVLYVMWYCISFGATSAMTLFLRAVS